MGGAMKSILFTCMVAMAAFAQAPPPDYQGQYPQGQYPQSQDPNYQGNPQDPNDAAQHGVARLSIVQGNVSVRHGDAGDLTGGAINAPLVVSDQVATGDGGRAEIQFDASNMIRLARGTDVRRGDLQYRRYLVQIAAGTTTFRTQRDNDADVEISTPSVS